MFVKEVRSGTRGTKIFLKCDVCGKEYATTGSRYRGRKTRGDYCSAECRFEAKHFTVTCVNCGKEYTRFRSHYSERDSTCCSRVCQFEQQKKGGIVSQKIVATNLKKYGVERPAQCEDVIEKYRDNEAWQSSLFKKGNVPWNDGLVYSDDPELQKITDKMMANHPSRDERREEWIEKIRETVKESFVTGKRTSPFCFFTEEQRREYLQLAAKARCQQIRSFSGWYVTKIGERLHYDSTWELERMKFYDNDERIKHWSRCRDQISYVFDNKKRRYNPDFILEYEDGRVVVEEVKGLFTEMTLAKYDAAVKFYEERETEFVMMTKSSKNAPFEHVVRDVMIERIRGRDYWTVVTNPNKQESQKKQGDNS